MVTESKNIRRISVYSCFIEWLIDKEAVFWLKLRKSGLLLPLWCSQLWSALLRFFKLGYIYFFLASLYDTKIDEMKTKVSQ